MNQHWSRLALYLYLAFGAGLFVLEIIGLRSDTDSFPSITQMTVAVMEAKWWMIAIVFGFICWLLIHFIRRII